MVSTRSLLYAAASDVTIERVRALVKLVGPESTTVEYKEIMSTTIAKSVAALANTYGGLLVVGVSDDRTIKGVKEKTIEAIAEHCNGKIEPPWVPEIIPVPLEPRSGLFVIVLRVIPGHHPRPLLVDGVAYVRHHNTSHPADWQRLRDLFYEGSSQQGDELWNVRRPSAPSGVNGTPDTAVDLVVRTGLNITIAREAKWRPLSELTVAALTQALGTSPLNSTLVSLLLDVARSSGSSAFHRYGFNRSRTLQLRWLGTPSGWPTDTPPAIEGRFRLEMPGGYGDVTTTMQIELDVVVRFSAAATELRQKLADEGAPSSQHYWRVKVHQVARLIDAMLATLTDNEVVQQLATLAGIEAIAVPQPRVLHFVTVRPVTEVLDTTGLSPIPDAGTSRGAHLLADPAVDLADVDERWKLIRMWLVQLALDAGIVGMEKMIADSSVHPAAITSSE